MQPLGIAPNTLLRKVPVALLPLGGLADGISRGYTPADGTPVNPSKIKTPPCISKMVFHFLVVFFNRRQVLV